MINSMESLIEDAIDDYAMNGDHYVVDENEMEESHLQDIEEVNVINQSLASNGLPPENDPIELQESEECNTCYKHKEKLKKNRQKIRELNKRIINLENENNQLKGFNMKLQEMNFNGNGITHQVC